MRALLPAALLALLLAACTAAPAEQETIRIGAILSLSGNDLAAISQAMQEGIDLAVEEVNSAGGIDGKNITIIYQDDQLDSTQATTASHKLLQERVSLSFIAGANTAKAAGPVFEQAQVPLLVLWDVNQDLKDIGEYTYGIGFSTEAAGYVMAERLHTQGVRKAAIIRHQDEWSQMISENFAKRFTELGGTVISDESLPVGTADFRTTLLKAQGADAIYAPLVGQLDLFFRQARDNGYGGILATGDSMTPDAISGAQGAAEGVIFTNVYTPESSRLSTLEERYRQNYGRDPELLVFTALGYDGVLVTVDAIRRAESDNPARIHDALYQTRGLEGAAGTVTIQSDGFAEKQEPIFLVKDGAIVIAE